MPAATTSRGKTRKTPASVSSTARSTPADLGCLSCGWGPARGALWPSLGGLAVRWISDNLILPEGDTFGEPFRPREDQRKFLYRWYEYCPRCNLWRYDEGVRGAATGDGKTSLIAAIALVEFGGPPQLAPKSPIVNVAAASYEQADELFRKAGQMVGGQNDEISEAPLCGFFKVYDHEIRFRDGKPGVLKRVAAVAGTNEGGLPSLFICDELHEWGAVGDRKARVHTVISKSTRKRNTGRGPGRVLNLSTAGFDKHKSLLGAMYKRGQKALADPGVAPKLLFDWQEAPDGLDYDNPSDRAKAVRAASKAAGELWNVADRVADWGKPSMPRHEWLRYYANRWVDMAEESWLSDNPTAWPNCRGPEAIPDLAEVVMSVDMALKRDSVAVLVAHQLDDERVVVRSRVFTAPVDGRIDHLDVLEHIRALGRAYTVAEITYDPRFFEVPARILEDEGFNMVEFPQSAERMSPAVGHAYEVIIDGGVVHDGDRDLTDHVQSAVPRPNERGFSLSKGKSRHKIDACIALVIALWRLYAPDEVEPVPEPWVAFA
ncbi:MAG: terminase TerL endonuclease subunit [Streptosporangiales bacterium]